MSLQFVAIAGPDKDRVFTVQAGENLMLGRGTQSFYRLTDPRASRAHCQVSLAGEEVTVSCNGGSGGTLVNGKPVQKQTLKLGDVVRVGDTELRLQMGDFPLNVALSAVAQAGGARVAPAQMADSLAALSGQKLAHFDIGPVIGRGSTSMVFHATDMDDNRSVALKVLLPEVTQNEEEKQRFIRSMKTAMKLRHPNLVAVYGAGKTGAYCWVSMEYVAGENLAQAIQRMGVAGMLDWKNAYKVAVQIGRALAYSHGEQVIHRNVTPKNVLIEATTKDAKLGDLLKAKALEGSLAQQITRPGELIGEVAYMSPERTRGPVEGDARSDLYGLGATVYALLTGRPPFEGATLIEKITRIRQDAPAKPTKYQMSIVPLFEGVVMKLLEKKPENRYQTADDMLRDLERVGKFSGVTVA